MLTEPRRPRRRNRAPWALRAGRAASALLGVTVIAGALWPRGTSEPVVSAAPSTTPTVTTVPPLPTATAPPTPPPTVLTPPAPDDPSDPAAYAARVRAAADDARAAQGLPRFADAACAAPVALDRATALVGRPLAHAPLDVVWTACPGSSVIGENLSRAGLEPAGVVAAWMASAGHRANLLNPTFTGMVVECARDGAQMVCSQLFVGPGTTPST